MNKNVNNTERLVTEYRHTPFSSTPRRFTLVITNRQNTAEPRTTRFACFASPSIQHLPPFHAAEVDTVTE
jgi:hypothetical protein